MNIKTLLSLTLLSISPCIVAQDVLRPEVAEWEKLIEGGQFMDLFEPMVGSVSSSDVWGAAAVKPRFIDNGIEDEAYSYWGGNIIKGDDNRYHLFVCGWPESNKEGHMGWLDASIVFHATSDSPNGSFKVEQQMGRGHNTEVIALDSGKFMVYNIMGHDDQTDCCYYEGNTIDGPWELKQLPYDLRDRDRIPGPNNWFHNMSFSKREDGSILMVNRGGCIWVSKDGDSTYNLISDQSVYPLVNGRYEDPVVWRDNVQYNMIVNDWYGRVAFYLRSKDGVNWITEPGRAYTPGVSVHADGTVEDWYKYERIRIFQDDKGRAAQANFAVIDTLKHNDLPHDTHSSKNIVVPLQKGLLLEYLSQSPIGTKTTELPVKILAEEGFDPIGQVDVESLRFGASTEVNYGRGAVALRCEASGKDLIVYFSGDNHCIGSEEFAPKMIGRNRDGEMIFGYSRLPWVNYQPAILSARKPFIKGRTIEVIIDNFGITKSKDSFITLGYYTNNGTLEQCASATLAPLAPYSSQKIRLEINDKTLALQGKAIVVEIHQNGEKSNKLHTTLK
ncbi:MAG: glycoside hydrolase family protein [Rikenellaceae bacterium]